MTVYHNPLEKELLNIALTRGEGKLAKNGALSVTTGLRTGRSPQDRFIVKDEVTINAVDWGAINQPISTECFEKLWQRTKDYLKTQTHFISHLAVGSDETYQIPVTVITELAWHQLFSYHAFIIPHQLKDPAETWTLLNAAQFKTDPERDGVKSDAALMIDFKKRRILLCGLHYAGEMKKAMFAVMNFLLPPQCILPMHCAANVGHDGNTALFFGLSGTGKTTLSADPNRYLIGDDEHGWGENGVFNFEGGCYAKCINLSAEREPLIWQAIRDGAIMENVVLDSATLAPCYDDDSLTQNTRAAYPLKHIKQRMKQNRGEQPKAIIFLTCDLHGVLPPVAKLSKEQAAYYFLSGYTALVGSTEVGQGSGIKQTFSTCFGAPFFPRSPDVYANLLLHHLEKTNCPVYLVNTGWTGGAYGEGGKRFDIPVTRTIVNAILNQELEKAVYEVMPNFKLVIPTAIKGIDKKLLNPKNAWQNIEDYNRHERELIEAFTANFKKFKVSSEIMMAGPV
ncbi:phosphoenolpyruvate carboxykinase [Gammaproteobacteria bacterium SCGC AG-212-F23]|nr:phosphoenolpyruvate carboxykinase [Gammaproteobacteria bacterium SCGC AG-212-F23]